MQAKIKRLPYEPSKWLTLGVELELQLVDPCGFDLVPRSADVLDALRPTTGRGQLVPEVTAGMIELSTGICESSLEVLADLASLRERLLRVADAAGVAVSGGGTHPFQDWTEQAIFAHPRFLELDALYGYVLKQYTVFGQHVHVGCADEERVPTLLHQLSRYVPHLIALSAASPFVHGLDTGYAAARLNTSSPLPFRGHAPFLLTWDALSHFMCKAIEAGVAASPKDFHWDIRPKPELGTLEVRVLDCPLTIERAAAFAGFVQALAAWLLEREPFEPQADDYLVYARNRFHAARYGLDASYIEPGSFRKVPLRAHLLELLGNVRPHARRTQDVEAVRALADAADDDASWLREQFRRAGDLASVVRSASLKFRAPTAPPRRPHEPVRPAGRMRAAAPQRAPAT